MCSLFLAKKGTKREQNRLFLEQTGRFTKINITNLKTEIDKEIFQDGNKKYWRTHRRIYY